MRPVKVYILTHKEKLEKEENIIIRMKKAVRIASQISTVAVNIELTTDFTQFESLSANPNHTPLLIIQNKVEFATEAPPVDLMRYALMKYKEHKVPQMQF